MKEYTKETDARIIIDDLLRKAGWDPIDKTQVLTEFTVRLSGDKVAEDQAPYNVKDGDIIPNY